MGDGDIGGFGELGIRQSRIARSVQLSVSPTRFSFTNPSTGAKVGTVQRSKIARLSGMAVLGSGSMVPIPFLHPSYPNRGVSISINESGDLTILFGNEVSIKSGFIDVYYSASQQPE
jgi:hypothetical protein